MRKPVVAVFLALVLIAGCGASARERAIHTALVSLDAARDGFVVWDKHHQDDIVAKATSLEAGTAALAAYRADRDTIVQAFVVAYSALAAAALDSTMAKLMVAAKTAEETYTLIRKLQGK